jgi:hypothetical protein
MRFARRAAADDGNLSGSDRSMTVSDLHKIFTNIERHATRTSVLQSWIAAYLQLFSDRAENKIWHSPVASLWSWLKVKSVCK